MIILGLLLGAVFAAEDQEKFQIVELIQEYTSMDLSPYQGKALFLNFFTEWCVYCMQEMDSIRKIHENYSREELQVVLVHVWDGEDASNTESVKRRFGMEDMVFYEDEKVEMPGFFGLTGYPTSLFIDREGFLSEPFFGAISFETMAAAVESMGVMVASGGEAAQ